MCPIDDVIRRMSSSVRLSVSWIRPLGSLTQRRDAKARRQGNDVDPASDERRWLIQFSN
jgi:hypothetical protein